ncbi:MAG: GspE/PulE family protein, partial [bacterium]
ATNGAAGGEITAGAAGGAIAESQDGAAPGQEAPGEIDPDALMAQMEEMAESSGEGQEEYTAGDANEAPVIKMCNYLIGQALKMRASDIHINPTAKGLTVRYRVDGTLQIRPSPNASLKRGIIARFKVMARMNITERRKPQDGRIKIRVLGKTIDLRVSVIPQMEGENIVMRILDQSSLQLDLRKLGFEEQEMAIYEDAIRSPYGMILHTGPTGSGKPTTLYSALSFIFDPKKAFITLEDPVEYEMPGIVQVQMDHDVGLDFAVALRSALRQDPNIMMLGEIRDGETARNAIQAALTGHLLFSTLHTNDAPGTISRLIDMGIAPAYVGTAVRLVVAQRLMKRICKHCKAPHTPGPEEFKRLEVAPAEVADATFMKGAGCPECGMTGYSGRIGLYEMLRNTPEMQELIFEGADSTALRKVAEAQGMRSLRGLAIEKWRTGLTTAEEVQRVTLGGD